MSADTDTELGDRGPVMILMVLDVGYKDIDNDNLVSLDGDGDGDEDGGWEKDVGGDEEDREKDKVARNLNLRFEISECFIINSSKISISIIRAEWKRSR